MTLGLTLVTYSWGVFNAMHFSSSSKLPGHLDWYEESKISGMACQIYVSTHGLLFLKYNKDLNSQLLK